MAAALDRVIEAAKTAMAAGDHGRAWAILRPHAAALSESAALSWCWLELLDASSPEDEDARAVLEVIALAWPQHAPIVDVACRHLMAPIDGRPADEPIPEDDPSHVAVRALAAAVERLSPEDARDPDVAGYLYNSLGNAYRHADPFDDEAAENAYTKALALAPDRSWWRFNLGLLYKQRGRWHDGVATYERVAREVGNEEPVLWNLGICATGAGLGEVAAAAWRALGFEVAIGDDGLPYSNRFGGASVRLSTGGIGRAHPGPGPVSFEHVWVERRSPCHGIVCNPTLHDVGADIGDTVLWDGQPIGRKRVGDRDVPRFAALATLSRGAQRTFRFVGSQANAGQLAALAERLHEGCRVYVFDEEMEYLCVDCIRTGGPHVDEHRPRELEPGAPVYGKLVVPSEVALAEVASLLDRALQESTDLVWASPAFREAIADGKAARRDHQIWDALGR